MGSSDKSEDVHDALMWGAARVNDGAAPDGCVSRRNQLSPLTRRKTDDHDADATLSSSSLEVTR